MALLAAVLLPCVASMPRQAAGIAAKYPGDRGIASDPRVVFAEDFENGSLAEVARRWTEASNKGEKVLALVNGGPGGSGHALQVTATLGQDTGGHLYKKLDRGVDKLYARFYVKFAEDAEYIHHFVTVGGYNPPTNWPQGGAGERPRGDDRITAGIEPMGGNGRFPAPGAWNFYTYWHEMKESADHHFWGNSIAPEQPPLVPRNQWQCVEVMMKLNSAPDKYDGEMALWLDGKPVLHAAKGTPRGPWTGLGFRVLPQGGELFEGFNFRTSMDLKLNFFLLMQYVTDNVARYNHLTSQKPINRVWFDNVVLATDYVGPIRR